MMGNPASAPPGSADEKVYYLNRYPWLPILMTLGIFVVMIVVLIAVPIAPPLIRLLIALVGCPVFAFSLGIQLFKLYIHNNTRLIVSAQGVVAQNPVFHWSTSWDNIDRIGMVDMRTGQLATDLLLDRQNLGRYALIFRAPIERQVRPTALGTLYLRYFAPRSSQPQHFIILTNFLQTHAAADLQQTFVHYAPNLRIGH